MKGRLPGDGAPEEGSAGESKIVAASPSDMGTAFNIVAAFGAEAGVRAWSRCRKADLQSVADVLLFPESWLFTESGRVRARLGRDFGALRIGGDGSLDYPIVTCTSALPATENYEQKSHAKWHCCRVCREQGNVPASEPGVSRVYTW